MDQVYFHLEGEAQQAQLLLLERHRRHQLQPSVQLLHQPTQPVIRNLAQDLILLQVQVHLFQACFNLEEHLVANKHQHLLRHFPLEVR